MDLSAGLSRVEANVMFANTEMVKNKTSAEVFKQVANTELNNPRNIAKIKALDALRSVHKANYVSLSQASRLNISSALSEAIPNPTEFIQVLEDGRFATKTTVEDIKSLM